MPKGKPQNIRKVNGKLTIGFLIDFYDAFLREESANAAAYKLKLHHSDLQLIIKKHPPLTEVLRIAQERRGQNNRLAQYTFDRLSPEAEEIWNVIQFWKGSKREHSEVDRMLKGRPQHLRQELFVHAFLRTTYDMSEACRMVGVSRDDINNWANHDPNFRKLLEEMRWHKKNFFEKALLDLVDQRNPTAVMFVNKTVNADRGYREKLQIEHSGSVSSGYGLDDLELDMETRKKILDAIRKKEEGQKAIPGPVVDVEEIKQLAQSTT